MKIFKITFIIFLLFTSVLSQDVLLTTGTMNPSGTNSNGTILWEIGNIIREDNDQSSQITMKPGFINTLAYSTNWYPKFEGVPQQTYHENDTVSIIITAIDKDNDNITYEAVTIPNGAQYSQDEENSIFTWNTTYADSGHYQLVFKCSDVKGGNDTLIVSLIIQNVNQIPFFNNGQNSVINVNETETISIELSARDYDDDKLNFFNKNLPENAIYKVKNDSIISFTWNTTYEDSGSYEFIFIVNDYTNTGDTVLFDVNVKNVNREPIFHNDEINFTYLELDTINISIITSDPDNDTINYWIDNKPDSAVFVLNENEIQFYWETNLLDAGNYSIKFGMSDGVDTTFQSIEINIKHSLLCFQDVVKPTGISYPVIIKNAFINDSDISNGDEIALYSDLLLVGAGVINSSLPVEITAWMSSDIANSHMPGATSGNDILFKFYDMEFNRTLLGKAIIGNGGHYGDGILTVVDSLFGYHNTPPVIINIPPININEDDSLQVYKDSLLNFISDFETDVKSLSISLESEGPNICITQNDKGYLIKPFQNWCGEDIIELSVSDSVNLTKQKIKVVVNPINDIPQPFHIIQPENNDVVTVQKPLLIWTSSENIDEIDEIFYTVSIGISLDRMVEYDIGQDTSMVVNPLLDNSIYYWKVSAIDLNGSVTENIGGIYSFKVNTQNDNPNGFALIFPEDSSMVTTHTPTFYWQIAEDIDPQKSTDDVKVINKTPNIKSVKTIVNPVKPTNYTISDYLFYINDSEDFSSVSPISVDTNNYRMESSLMENQVYYWKVEAVDNLGGVTSSAVWSFWTNKENSVPQEFTLLTPFGITAAVTPSFTWTQSSDNDLQDTLNYLLKYGTSPYDLINIPTGNQTQYVPEEPLRDNTEYIWQVSARDISGAVFTTPFLGFFVNTANDNPEQFTQIFPDSNEIITSQNPLMFWNITTDVDYHAVKYVLYLGTDTQTMEVLDTVDVNYYRPGELTDGVYYWKVTAIDYHEGEQNTSIWPFTVNAHNEPPGEFALLSPLSDSVFTILTPTLNWQPAIDNDENDTVIYAVEYGKTIDSISIINTGKDTQYTFDNPLEDNSFYYWRVVACDMAGAITINTGGFQRFVVNIGNDVPEAPQLLSPDSVIVLSPDCNLRWTPAYDPDPFDSVHYEVHWYDNEMNFAVVNTNTYRLPEFNENNLYNWYVISIDMKNDYCVTDTAMFWVDAIPEPPTTFATISPPNETAGLGSEIVFSWQESVDPDPFDLVKYDIVYTLNTGDSTTYEYVSELADTTVTLNMTGNGVYYWKVLAKDNDQFKTISNNDEWHVFTVGNVAIDGGLLIPEEFALHSNFPNPFNPTTTIRYDIPKTSHVTLTIYNMNGQVVERLVTQKQEPGFYSVNWDARNVSTGVYFYRIQAEGFQQVKKMLLIK